jgi:polysaccharide pyruvyl transferase CsaB
MKHVVISGYYGFDNAGDEAVLAGLISGLHNSLDSAHYKVNVLSINPSRTVSQHRVAASHRYKNFLRPLAKCDLLMSGGGSLLQDVTSAHGIFYYLAIVRLAQLLGRKTMFVAQGIGPLMRRRSQKLTASVANRLDAITVRDPASSELLKSIGVRKPITITADPALLLETPQNQHRHGVLLSMRPWTEDAGRLRQIVVNGISSSSLPTQIEALNMYGDADNAAAAAVIESLRPSRAIPSPAGYNDGFRLLMSKTAESEFVIGMRLHSLIFAASNAIPSVALSYDPKVDAFMKQSGQADAVFDISTGAHEELSELLTVVWETRDRRREDLFKTIPTLRESAQKNADIAAALLR